MEIKINFNSESTKDLLFVKALGTALKFTAAYISGEEEEPKSEPATESAPEPESAPVEEAPKKRSRKKKEEPKDEPKEEPQQEAQQEAQPLDNTSELPFDNEPEQEVVAEPEPVPEPEPKPEVAKNEFPKMTKDEWVKVNQAKRAELGLDINGEHANLIREFNTYCQKQSNLFWGTPKPSTLPEEKLWQFAEWFKTIQLNKDYVPGSADSEHSCPFVSDVPSKE